MSKLVEGLSRFFGRVEIFARGAEHERRAAEEALARGRPLEAREQARLILDKVPDSPLGLALWADAAEEAWLDHEVVQALGALSRAVPWRADVWYRLGRAGARIEWPQAREALERAASASEQREYARLALLELCDMDLAAKDSSRAERWLARVPVPLRGVDREVALRLAECALARSDASAAAAAVAPLGEDVGTDPRFALVMARLAATADGPSTPKAFELGLRALILDAPGAGDFLAGLTASCRDVVRIQEVRDVVTGLGVATSPTWAAAFAFAEGRRDDARQALAAALEAGAAGAAAALRRLAVETQDAGALALLAANAPVSEELQAVARANELVGAGELRAAFDALDAAGGEAMEWARVQRASVVSAWLGDDVAAWSELTGELRRAGRDLDALDALGQIEALALERERPLRLAVVGEFNAGKSTFLNALLGEDVAPTGVLPTTATLHWVAWAPDPFARILVRGAPDRVVPHASLKKALRELNEQGASVERVYIYAPIERLKRVEILDTPGFNAPDAAHVKAARGAFDEAHAVVWLLDATQPLKETERAILSEVRGLGIPIQVLLNKIDRVAEADRATVAAHVEEALAEAGLASIAPAAALSAKHALAGRLGDAGALAASGWAGVEALLTTHIVNESDALKERALRRRARSIARALLDIAGGCAREERERALAAQAAGERLRTAAAHALREQVSWAGELDRALEPARRGLAADLAPLRELPPDRVAEDAGLRAYVAQRSRERLGDALARELGAKLYVEVPRRVVHVVGSVVAGASVGTEGPVDLSARPGAALVEVAIDAFARALELEAEAKVGAPRFALVEERLLALSTALEARSVKT